VQNPLQVQGPPTGVVDCEPDLKVATRKLFDLRNKKKPGNFIQAEITLKGYLKYYVENLPKDGRGCPGKWLFEIAWSHFVQRGVTLKGIRGDWTFADNLNVVNQLTAGNQMTVEEAARRTWAYERARDKGFAAIIVIDTDGNPGSYRAVDVLFLPGQP
jgi:hypothetical protein